MNSLYTNQQITTYKLSMQTLSDELDERHIEHQFLNSGEKHALEGVRIYNKGARLLPRYIYLILPEDLGDDLRWSEKTCFVVFGKANAEDFSFTTSILGILSELDPYGIFNTLQDIFDKYATWDKELNWAMHSKIPPDKMLEVSRNIFENPIFLHDKDFYVLSCPRWVSGMLQWEKEPRTGREMIPLELINTFRVDDEYLATLKTHGASTFSSTIRGYRVLYTNLWSQEHYRGRLCIDELERPLRKSDYEHLNHLAYLLSMYMDRHKLFWRSIGRDIDAFFTNALSGSNQDPHMVTNQLRYLNWGEQDSYIVLKIVSARDDYRAITPSTLFGFIEAQINDCRALMYQQDIVAVVNLTPSGTNISDVLSALAYLMRDGLFKIGVSSELRSFSNIHYGYTQASIALEYGQRSSSMLWYHHFRDHALQFLLDSSSSKLPSHLLGSEKLDKLRKYDKENNTEFYRTAEIYLKKERNAVVTANELFIHRSTLFYRLKRIEEISGIDFDNEQERLYLLLSFALPVAE